MAREVLHLQQVMTQLRKEAPSPEDMETQDVCKGLIYAIKQIADSIAWRLLNFDRVVIHELAFAPQTGHLQLQAVLSELERAASHIERYDSPVILNDLTNFLRCGDLTIVTETAVLYDEVKAGRGSRKSGRAKHQRRRAEKVIEFINRRELETKDGRRRLVLVDVEPRSHIEHLGRLIVASNASGHAAARLSDAIAVDVFDVDKAAEAGSPREEDFNNPFRQSPYASTFSNFDHFGIFSPNIAPYSVFPIAPEQRVDLMTGRLLLFVYVNAGNFIRALRRHGLRARMPTKTELDQLPNNLRPGEIRANELRAPIMVANDTHTMLISMGELGRMGYELLNEESLADLLFAQLRDSGPEEESHYSAFRREWLLWN